MKTTIYYFSGTGNSLHAARTIARQLPDCRLVNIANLAGQPKDQPMIEESDDLVGFVFPVYYWDMPDFVRSFLEKISFSGTPYIFVVATMGALPGNTLVNFKTLIEQKGQELSAGFTVIMPDNAYVGHYMGMNHITPPRKREPMLDRAEQNLKAIADQVTRRDPAPVKARFTTFKRTVIWETNLVNRVYGLPKRLHATAACARCGACSRICPTSNITISARKVEWDSKCALCLACFHWCPQNAVQVDKKTPRIARYHHPDVSLKDMYVR
ncbi:MAG TPA: EFR1 family ferrodoxin [Methanocella sp.]|nr:EFR1 family ferrodoxin [Methanocella sp.]